MLPKWLLLELLLLLPRLLLLLNVVSIIVDDDVAATFHNLIVASESRLVSSIFLSFSGTMNSIVMSKKPKTDSGSSDQRPFGRDKEDFSGHKSLDEDDEDDEDEDVCVEDKSETTGDESVI